MRDGAEPTQPGRYRTPPLKASMACEAAFRTIARLCIDELDSRRPAVNQRNRDALHDMRVALTRLRTAISLFSPMIADSEHLRLKGEFKWLNGVLGTARDLDVAIDRLKAVRERRDPVAADRSWRKLHADSHRRLASALRSARYRYLIDDISAWVEDGAWSRSERSANLRTTRIARYGISKLTRWHKNLLKKAKGLGDMDVKQTHRLRRRSKRLRYSIEFLADLLQDSCSRSALKHLRKAQSCLGELNDASRSRSIAASLRLHAPGWLSDDLHGKRERRLIRSAAQAYRKLPALAFKESGVSGPKRTTR